MPAGSRGFAMDLFTQLFSGLLAFVYHCFDRVVIYGYLSGLSRPERVVNFFHQVVGVSVISREILSKRTADYQNWGPDSALLSSVPVPSLRHATQGPSVERAESGPRKAQPITGRQLTEPQMDACS
jgi:hypothetical protein